MYHSQSKKEEEKSSTYPCRPGSTEEEDGVVVFACLGTDQVRSAMTMMMVMGDDDNDDDYDDNDHNDNDDDGDSSDVLRSHLPLGLLFSTPKI